MSVARMVADWRRTPGMLKIVMLATVLAFVGDMWTISLVGYRLAGIAWFVPMVLALLVILRHPNRVVFPWWLWSPWLAILVVNAALIPFAAFHPEVDPLQRTVQLLCPVVIGVAASLARPSTAQVEGFVATFRRLIYVLVILIGVRSGILLTGQLPDWSGLAPEAITVTLLCAFAVSAYLVLRKRGYLVLWVVLLCIPVVMVARMPIVACLLTLPIAFGPMRMWRRVAAVILVLGVGLAVFYMPAFQAKTFYGGSGGLSEVRLSNPDLATAGRNYMWTEMAASTSESLWLGQGTGAGETLIREITPAGLPHNDWLLTLYDYGIVGVVCLVIAAALALRNALAKARSAHGPPIRLLLLTGATAFIPFAVMMISDNILVYASFFGNIQFAILGLGYGALVRERSDLALRTHTMQTH
jgi:hypothetical protein